MSEQLDRNLALELVRVTEGAALAAARWMGRASKDKADASRRQRDALAARANQY